MPIWERAPQWTVLIVEDEPDNLGVPEEILKFRGATVHTAEDGEAGLRQLTDITPTFVLLDLSMPNMDGWEMLRHIRADEREWIRSLPVIALTAHVMSGDRDRVREAGFDGYIPKPFFLDTFWDEIERAVGHLI